MAMPIITNYILTDEWGILRVPVWSPIIIEVVLKTFLKLRVLRPPRNLIFLFEKPTISFPLARNLPASQYYT